MMNVLCVLGVVTRAKRSLPYKVTRNDALYVYKREYAKITPFVENEGVIQELLLKYTYP
jgi:hypothetical protein